jgi:hypothetical protein
VCSVLVHVLVLVLVVLHLLLHLLLIILAEVVVVGGCFISAVNAALSSSPSLLTSGFVV